LIIADNGFFYFRVNRFEHRLTFRNNTYIKEQLLNKKQHKINLFVKYAHNKQYVIKSKSKYMKELIYSLLFIAIVKTTSAQEPAHIITRDYVDKVLKTLSSDEMAGRGISTPGIEKASVFIESQFKNIGLKPLEGAKGYEQGFYVYQVKPGQTAIQINGKSIDPSNVITLVNNAGEINFDQTNSDGWIRIDSDKPFKAQLPPLRSSKKRLLVLVDQKFAADFKLMREFNSMGTIAQDKELNQPGSPAIILVLAPDTLAKDFSVSIKYDARKLSLHNIAGMIPGKSKATETVIISGHYDHLGILQPVGQDSIANGAIVNGTDTPARIPKFAY
jgi:hypothetical protein